MTYPADWLVTEKEGEWKTEKVLYPYDPGLDTFGSRKTIDVVIVGAQSLPDGTTFDTPLQ